MNLPSTYYDILLQSEPELIELVTEDIKFLSDKAPFGSIDEYDNSFNEYIHQINQTIFQDVAMQYGNFDIRAIQNKFASSPEYKQFFQFKSVNYLTLTNFCLFGKKTFFINDNLAEQMAYTSLEVDSEFVKLPFLSCLLIFKDKTTIKALSDLDNQNSNILPDAPINVFCNMFESKDGDRKIVFACWQATLDETTIFVKRELLLKKGWKINDILKTEWTDIFSNNNDTHENLLGRQNNDSVFYEDGMTFFRIVLNTVLYLSSTEKVLNDVTSPRTKLEKQLTNIKNKAKKKKALRRIDKTSRLDCIYVGADTPPVAQNYTNETRQTINKRFIVRGHWRNQAYGPKLSQNKIIWIKPYYKGPEIADLINKPYKAK